MYIDAHRQSQHLGIWSFDSKAIEGFELWSLGASNARVSGEVQCDRLGVGREGTTRAEDAQGTPTQSHIPPSISVYEDRRRVLATALWGLRYKGTSLIRE